VLLLAAAPFLVRRFVEPAADPRAMVWVWFGLLASLALAVVGLAVFLFVFFAPHALMGRVGTVCRYGDFCLHTLPSWVQFAVWPTITALLGWVVVRMGWTGLAAIRASRRVKRYVFSQATPIKTSASYPVFEVADPTVFAWTVGVRRPLIVVSQGLRESLPQEELEVVLAHEGAHAAGHDNLLLLAALMVGKALFFVPGVTRAHRGVLRSVEISADAFASRGTGDRLLVAASVSRVARLRLAPARSRSLAARALGAAIGAAFAHAELAVERVQRLVLDQGLATSRRRLLSGVAVLALALVIFGVSLYSVAGNSLTVHPQTAVCAESASR
jgi:Zn-dependent protease with chaperone function